VTAATVSRAGRRRVAPAVERRDIDAAGPELANQQGGDEIPGQAEEDGHTDEAVDQRPGGGVLAENQQNGHGTDPIQPRMVITIVHEVVGHEPVGHESTSARPMA
jgi:hypothetical protein